MSANTADNDDQEGQAEPKYPKAVFLIVGYAFCENFHYYGIRILLDKYLRRKFQFIEDTSAVYYQYFEILMYTACIVGAIVADNCWGKFKTILCCSVLNVCGSVCLILSAIPTYFSLVLTVFGVILVAVGAGGVKPCVAAFGADQFQPPQQLAHVATFFSMFYFMTKASPFVAIIVFGLFGEDVCCFGDCECFPLAFAVPSFVMFAAIGILLWARDLYKDLPPAKGMFVSSIKAIANALSTKRQETNRLSRAHWLDYAQQKYDRELIEDVKVLMRLLVLFLPLPVFWALFNQQGNRSVIQATQMNGDIIVWNIEYQQLQMINLFLILALIPLFDLVIYPALLTVGIIRPLQKLTMAGILMIITFVFSALVEFFLQKTYPVLPRPHFAQLRVYNGELCSYRFITNIPGLISFEVNEMDWYVNKVIPVFLEEHNMTFSIADISIGVCMQYASGSHKLQHNTAHGLFIGSMNANGTLQWYVDEVDREPWGRPLVRTLCNLAVPSQIVWKSLQTDTIRYQQNSLTNTLTEFHPDTYDLYVNDLKITEVTIKSGGVYTIVINDGDTSVYGVKVFQVTNPNSMHMLWLTPQILLMTMAGVIFPVTGMAFTYTQAPISMKSMLQAIWLLTIYLGDVIIILIASLRTFETQSNELILFAVIMVFTMLLFSFLAYLYKPNTPRM